jgi:hypothetical protein
VRDRPRGHFGVGIAGPLRLFLLLPVVLGCTFRVEQKRNHAQACQRFEGSAGRIES